MPATNPKDFRHVPSASGEIVRWACARLRKAGIKLAPLLLQARLNAEQIDDRAARLSLQSQIKFVGLAAEALHDDLLGFRLARDYDLREIGLLYYVLASSDTMAEAIRRAERYSTIVNEGVSLQFHASPQTTIALSFISHRGTDRHQIEFWLTSFVRLLRQLTNRQLLPSQIRVVHRGGNAPAELRSFFGCQIEFGSDVDEVVFAKSVQALPIVSADPYLNKLLVRYCDEALAHRHRNRAALRSKLEDEVARLLPHGRARASEIASRLGLSQRTLARRLASEGSTFSAILHELKVDLAKRYLNEDGLPVSEVAWLLGYQEASAFTHAFKHWTGTSPRQFRTRGPECARDRDSLALPQEDKAASA